MQLDKQKLALLLMLPDKELKQLVESAAKEAGVDPRALGLDPEKIGAVRQALAGANERDLAEINRLLNEKKNGGN